MTSQIRKELLNKQNVWPILYRNRTTAVDKKNKTIEKINSLKTAVDFKLLLSELYNDFANIVIKKV